MPWAVPGAAWQLGRDQEWLVVWTEWKDLGVRILFPELRNLQNQIYYLETCCLITLIQTCGCAQVGQQELKLFLQQAGSWGLVGKSFILILSKLTMENMEHHLCKSFYLFFLQYLKPHRCPFWWACTVRMLFCLKNIIFLSPHHQPF